MNAFLRFPDFPSARTVLLPVLLLLVGCSASNASIPDAASAPERQTRDVLTAEQIQRYPAASTVEELLTQHFRSIYIVRRHQNPGASGEVHLLGAGGPLFVIDGVPIEYRGSLGINPRDVARIELVKFGGTAMYGMRGANGVVLIETRKD